MWAVCPKVRKLIVGGMRLHDEPRGIICVRLRARNTTEAMDSSESAILALRLRGGIDAVVNIHSKDKQYNSLEHRPSLYLARMPCVSTKAKT